MNRSLALLLLLVPLAGCVNHQRFVDRTPDGEEAKFRGLGDYVEGGKSLYVIQVHGMGDHSYENDCSDGSGASRSVSRNVLLQREIAERLGYVLDPDHVLLNQAIPVAGTPKAGSFSISRYRDLLRGRGDIYFSCVTWGETTRVIKQGMLELDGNFLETNRDESRRALINREAKRFVNRSFTDPVIYLGSMGGYIRHVVWSGMALSLREHARLNALEEGASQVFGLASITSFAEDKTFVIISDSLGSRVVFDAIAENDQYSAESSQQRPSVDHFSPVRPGAVSVELGQMLANHLRVSVRSVYMFANQLPLLELGYMPPPSDEESLEDWVIARRSRYCSLPEAWTVRRKVETDSEQRTDQRAEQREELGVQLVAFTDANDALSYRLSESFVSRCGRTDTDSASGGLEIINVGLSNARLRWMFVYSDLVEAHSEGFKRNSDAIEYVVSGND